MRKGNRKPKQLALIPETKKVFGGSLLKGNPKAQRPLSLKAPLHLVLKANRGFGARSMLHPDHVRKVNVYVRKQADRCGIRIYHFVNMGNHLHLIIKIFNRDRFHVFIRAISGLIARQVLGLQRGTAKPKSNTSSHFVKAASSKDSANASRSGYWLKRPFTRIASWGNDYNGLRNYLLKNQRQAGPIPNRLGSMVPGFVMNISIEPFQNST